MSGENTANITQDLEQWLKSDVYRENADFWARAWNMVKTPYTQMPDLPYITAIPEALSRQGVRRVLDLGCGSGWLSIFLARQGFFVTGVDLAEHAVELARQSSAISPTCPIRRARSTRWSPIRSSST